MREPLAFLITFHTYGTWLQGDERGWHDRAPRRGCLPGSNALRAWQAASHSAPRQHLDTAHRAASVAAIREVCDHRGWPLYAVHAREDHVHVVVALAGQTPERAMAQFKAWATRRMREAEQVASDARVWSRHGSTRWLWDARSVAFAIRYVVEGQGPAMAVWHASIAGAEL
jgi:REP element-mobilizing transposase RayT